MPDKPSFLQYVPPSGIYQTLYSFLSSFGTYMGEQGTSPWTQGSPRTDQIPGGPALPTAVNIDAYGLKYPKAWGLPKLRESIADYYNHYYSAGICSDNVMIFAGGRPGLIATLLFLARDINIRIASTEYTPYYDMLENLKLSYSLVQSNEANQFNPDNQDYFSNIENQRTLALLSNPCNPTGITRSGEILQSLVQMATEPERGLLIDEAYEFFHDPPVSALEYIDNIDETNHFVIGAATKGLQAPGIRIGWVISSKYNIEILGNFSSIGIGGVSHLSQCYADKLFQPDHMTLARTAIPEFYAAQRQRYASALSDLGIQLYSGNGGFYHWCKLVNGLTAQQFNQCLFKHGAAILKGTDCDMARLGDESPLTSFFRFSFGPLKPESFDSDISILSKSIIDN